MITGLLIEESTDVSTNRFYLMVFYERNSTVKQAGVVFKLFSIFLFSIDVVFGLFSIEENYFLLSPCILAFTKDYQLSFPVGLLKF